MSVKQIFVEYDFNGNDGIANLQFCPVCGTQCLPKEDGGRIRPACPTCEFVHYKNPAPGVSVLIIQDNQVLLGKRSGDNFRTGKWCLPCGFIEYDEDFLSAAIREVNEETGLKVEIKSIISVNLNFLVPEIHSLVIVLLGQVIGGSLKAGDDIDSLGWKK